MAVMSVHLSSKMCGFILTWERKHALPLSIHHCALSQYLCIRSNHFHSTCLAALLHGTAQFCFSINSPDNEDIWTSEGEIPSDHSCGDPPTGQCHQPEANSSSISSSLVFPASAVTFQREFTLFSSL